jgi:hypothetical protein
MKGRAITTLADRGNTPEARVLLASLHQDRSRLEKSGIENLSPDQWSELVTLAGQQRVRPLMHQRLLETGRWKAAPESAWKRLGDECRLIAMRKMRMHAELAHILTTLAAADIPTIVLKGAYLGPTVYKNIALREMSDLDIMVPRNQLESAVALVMAQGYEGIHKFSVESDARAGHHVTRLIKGHVAAVEVHWALTPPCDQTASDPQPLWWRARPVILPGATAFSLSSADLLLHLCVHTSFQHQFEFGLRPSCDIACVIAHEGDALDWSEVVSTSERHGWSRGVALALRLARDLVGADVPDSALRQMRIGDEDRGIAIASQLTWATPNEIAAFAAPLAPLGGGTGLTHKLGEVLGRIKLTRPQLTALYRIREDAWWWRLLYIVRLGDLLRRHSAAAVQLLWGRNEASDNMARQRNDMAAWLRDRTR